MLFRSPWVENCEFYDTCDDAYNFSAHSDAITKKLANNKIRVKPNVMTTTSEMRTAAKGNTAHYFGFEVGDELVFYNYSTMYDDKVGKIVATRRIVNIENCEDGINVDLTLDGDISDDAIVVGEDMKTATNIKNAQKNIFVVSRNNTIKYIKRNAIFGQGNGVLIEKNTIEDIGATAISIYSNPGGGHGSVARDFMIRNNTIRRTGLDLYEMSSFKLAHMDKTYDPMYKNITLCNNIVLDYDVKAILVRYIYNLNIYNNTIGNEQNTDFYGKNGGWDTKYKPSSILELDGTCTNVNFRDNVFFESRPIDKVVSDLANSKNLLVENNTLNTKPYEVIRN